MLLPSRLADIYECMYSIIVVRGLEQRYQINEESNSRNIQ